MNTDVKEMYAYIFEGNGSLSTIEVEEDDLIENADGILDCPLDNLLRKHNISLYDLNELIPVQLSFVKMDDEKTIVLKKVCLTINL